MSNEKKKARVIDAGLFAWCRACDGVDYWFVGLTSTALISTIDTGVLGWPL